MDKWPSLILKQFCTTEITVEAESEEISEDGAPLSNLSWSGKCNYQDKAKRVYVNDKEYVEVTGTCLIPGDIAPDMDVIPGGTVTIFERARELVSGRKARNPDGSVNYTQLEIR